MKFFLGAHQPAWMPLLKVPLFVSRRRLERYRKPPVAAAPWALDSGGFSELRERGSWDAVPPRQYAAEALRWMEACGRMQWAACQDWMCEDLILARTGLTVLEHQERTTSSFLNLQQLEPRVPWVPVLQGYEPEDYLRHRDHYRRYGVQLELLPLVGVGSVCRRQHEDVAQAERIIRTLASHGLRLHAFGFKQTGLVAVADCLVSADSMAWSRHARNRPPLPQCVGVHRSCANCPRYALRWRKKLLSLLEQKGGPQ